MCEVATERRRGAERRKQTGGDSPPHVVPRARRFL
jgi:hypothetical protein